MTNQLRLLKIHFAHRIAGWLGLYTEGQVNRIKFDAYSEGRDTQAKKASPTDAAREFNKKGHVWAEGFDDGWKACRLELARLRRNRKRKKAKRTP